MLYFHRTPRLLEWLYPGLTWHMDRTMNQVYLTFDDGPVPSMTLEILDILKNNGAKATFFCVGDNVRKHPEILQQSIEEGHSIGNHTFHHMNGWSASATEYNADIEACDTVLAEMGFQTSLFRPPYGKISRAQARLLRSRGKQIIMWDVLTGDFDTSLSWRQCLERTMKHIRPGSVVVLHDNPKARARTMNLLPLLIDHIKSLNCVCSALPS